MSNQGFPANTRMNVEREGEGTILVPFHQMREGDLIEGIKLEDGTTNRTGVTVKEVTSRRIPMEDLLDLQVKFDTISGMTRSLVIAKDAKVYVKTGTNMDTIEALQLGEDNDLVTANGYSAAVTATIIDIAEGPDGNEDGVEGVLDRKSHLASWQMEMDTKAEDNKITVWGATLSDGDAYFVNGLLVPST